jgi:hypothetical protein
MSAVLQGMLAGLADMLAEPAAGAANPDVSCSARNADSPERRLAVGLTAAKTPKAD